MTELRRQRPQRRPIGTGNVLTAAQRPGFVRRFVNDHDGRVERFLEAGYEIVRNPAADTSDPKAGKASNLGSPVRKSVGGGMHAVLMEIPADWYAEDQANKQREISDVEQSMRRPNVGDGQYGSVDISQ
jgi:hypothetical protein